MCSLTKSLQQGTVDVIGPVLKETVALGAEVPPGVSQREGQGIEPSPSDSVAQAFPTTLPAAAVSARSGNGKRQVRETRKAA